MVGGLFLTVSLEENAVVCACTYVHLSIFMNVCVLCDVFHLVGAFTHLCVCVCVCACVHACVRACVRAILSILFDLLYCVCSSALAKVCEAVS